MNLDEKEQLEDMIVAILLSQVNIRRCDDGKRLYFKLEQRKIRVFLDYVIRFNLKKQFSFDPQKLEGYIKPSYMLEKVLKTWVWDNKVQVIDPPSLRLNVLFIWISLFAKKTLQGVAIPTELSPDLQYTLMHLFHNIFDTYLLRGKPMQIKPFCPVVLRAIQTNRPLEESMELSYLLPHFEKEAIKQMVIEWEEENSYYAF